MHASMSLVFGKGRVQRIPRERPLRILALTLCAAASAAAQSTRSDSLSAPIHDVHYDVTYLRGNAQRRAVDVAMTFTTAGTAPVVLSLPAWTPGAYEISNFARWVTDFTVTGDGKPATWDKLDFDTWRIRPSGAKS